MKIAFTCVVGLILIASSTAQRPKEDQSASAVPQPQVAAFDWRESWRNATTALGQVGHDSLINRDFFSAVGTGVLISTAPDTAYLVTAKHVLCDPDKRPGWYPSQLNVRFAWQDRKSIYAALGITVPLRTEGSPIWFTLDDESDVAVLKFFSPDEINKRLPENDRQTDRINIIGAENLEADVYEGEQVLVFGFPALAGNDRLARILVRQGIVAWTDPTIPSDRVFLVDANLYLGNSGGPVIKFPFGLMKDGHVNYVSGGAPKLLGIVSQVTAQDLTATFTAPPIGKLESHGQIAGVGSIGIIEPASKVLKLLTMAKEGTAKAGTCEVNETKAVKK